jgi:hypothetical protein
MFESWKEREFEKKMERFRTALQEKNTILIGAGAGLSTSAGFTYSGERFRKYFADFENCASHSRYFSDELDAQFFYIKQNKCLIYYYGYGKILLWRKICLQLIKMVFPIRRQGKSCGENICEIRLIVL